MYRSRYNRAKSLKLPCAYYMTLIDGLMQGAKQCPSEHFNQRTQNTDIELLVIHNISLPAGNFSNNYVEDLFCGNLDTSAHTSFIDLKGVRVSAHLFIRRNAQVIQFVNFEERAWHAGKSTFKGRSNCNDFSIGIEMEGTDTQLYSERQYQTLIQVTQQIMRCYPKISVNNICGHCDIAPGRKTDPGPSFDWQFYRNSLIK